jgi:ferric-dicitrate binding protein FerR (iron transport regulator)
MALTKLAFLYQKYYDKTATPEERTEFMRLAQLEEHAAELQQLMEESWDEFGGQPVFTAEQSEEMLGNVMREAGVQAPVRRIRWSRVMAAAVIIGMLGFGVWWWVRPVGHTVVGVAAGPALRPVVAGGNKAELILDNGSVVTLDSAKNGLVSTQGKTQVVKVAGGQLKYTGNMNETAVLYNTVRTPRGGQYQVALPDGSRVWLNAATALRFPTAFNGKDRTVELTGEAYFEIAARKDQPFRVKVRDMTVDVLGTHFNVNAYDDEESFRATLLEGAVRVNDRVLKPGQEARMMMDSKELSVEAVDTDQVVAWKNGLFQFEGATVEAVMRQVARWYDVDVQYAGKPTKHCSGLISRNTPLAEVLHIIGRTSKTSFTLEGRTVIVRPS